MIINDLPAISGNQVALIHITAVNELNDKLVAFNLSADQTWLTLSETSGSCSDTIPFNFDATAKASDLEEGSNLAIISFTSSDPNCQSQEAFEIEVTLTKSA